ncbi:hypothetical protein ROLI_036840 [Roseobacter fucihabitans]|uniref:4Fe-4S ferredoxin-type domain-containing protein n=1 Tax=Roseobacter fucihabitans TaxID=1537242 RepID=A0ABZ2BXP7_9RHOB|nr:hypothetical protein [Roseobacter litoralis]
MQTSTQKTPVTPKQNCLGCTDCKGICRELYELAFLPGVVLQRSAASP